jgi:outer membrane protein assembly factor BamB
MIATILLFGGAICVAGSDESALPLPATIKQTQGFHSSIARAGFDRTGHYSTESINWQRKVAWKTDTMGLQGGSHALLLNRKIYYVDGLGLRVYSADDGTHLWTWTPKERINEYSHVVIDPLIYNETIFLSLWSSNNYTALVALDANDGQILWQYKSDIVGDAQSPVIYKNDIIFSIGSYVISIDMETKKDRWRFNAQESVWDLTLSKDTLLFGTNKSTTGMYAIDASNGKKKWNGSKNGVSLYYVPVSA